MIPKTGQKKPQLAWSPEERARLIHLREQNPGITWTEFLKVRIILFHFYWPPCVALSFFSFFFFLFSARQYYPWSWLQRQPSLRVELPALINSRSEGR